MHYFSFTALTLMSSVLAMPTPQDISEPETQGDGPAPVESGLYSCGSAYYAPDQYVCYGDFLCPIVGDETSIQCGDACYLESLYTCDQGTLVSLDQATGADGGETATETETETSGDDSSESTSTSDTDEPATSDVGSASDETSEGNNADNPNTDNPYTRYGDDDSSSTS
ncbi:MAG: hypothetical protein Q9221_009044 [Calogaya cf. arnoldii]